MITTFTLNGVAISSCHVENTLEGGTTGCFTLPLTTYIQHEDLFQPGKDLEFVWRRTKLGIADPAGRPTRSLRALLRKMWDIIVYEFWKAGGDPERYVTRSSTLKIPMVGWSLEHAPRSQHITLLAKGRANALRAKNYSVDSLRSSSL